MTRDVSEVYEAFLALIEGDDWMLSEEEEIARKDWRMLLNAAIFRFTYPRMSLEIEGEQFVNEISNDEIQVLAAIMKQLWVERCVATWDNIRQLYTYKNFHQANHLDKLVRLQQDCRKDALLQIDRYQRSDNHKPSPLFSRLAGKR